MARFLCTVTSLVSVIGRDESRNVCLSIFVIGTQGASAPRYRINLEMPNHRDVRKHARVAAVTVSERVNGHDAIV